MYVIINSFQIGINRSLPVLSSYIIVFPVKVWQAQIVMSDPLLFLHFNDSAASRALRDQAELGSRKLQGFPLLEAGELIQTE